MAAATAVNARGILLRRQGNFSEYDLDEYGFQVCHPEYGRDDSRGDSDLNAPCPAMDYVWTECTYGSVFAAKEHDPYVSDLSYPPENTEREKQICICQSQFFDLWAGCDECYTAHGLDQAYGDEDVIPKTELSSFKSSYCQATMTAPPEVYSAWEAVVTSLNPPTTTITNYGETSSGQSIASTYSLSDPIGNKTDASLYFTPAVSGSAEYIFFESQPGISVRTTYYDVSTSYIRSTVPVSQTSSRSSRTSFATDAAGDIVPTASGASTVTPTAGTTTRSGAAVATLTADRVAAVGVLGLAAVVAYL